MKNQKNNKKESTKKKSKGIYKFDNGLTKYTLNFNKKISLNKIKNIEDLVNSDATNLSDLAGELVDLYLKGTKSLKFFNGLCNMMEITLPSIYGLIYSHILDFDGVKLAVSSGRDYLDLKEEILEKDILKLYKYLEELKYSDGMFFCGNCVVTELDNKIYNYSDRRWINMSRDL